VTAHQIFVKVFTDESLISLFDEKVGHSTAVGRDGIRRGKFEDNLDNEIELVLKKTDSQTYEFTGYKQKLISKGVGKPPRQLSIPTFRDRLTLRALCEVVTEVFEDSKAPPPHHYIKEIHKLTSSLGDGYAFLRVDVKDYYPSINHALMMQRVRARIRKPQILDLIMKAMRTPTGKRNIADLQNENGVPQGLSISNILASIYLRNIDKKYKSKTNYFRYVDDILIICPLSQAKKVYYDLYRDLLKLDLVCHSLDADESGKTRISTLECGIEYLGYHITATSISVRESSYQKMYMNLLKVFTSYRYSRNKPKFLWRLNLKITGCAYEGRRKGWMYFFSQSENKSQLVRLDNFVASQIVKHRVEDVKSDVKTFIKAYHEIRFNGDDTTYIPNFESYTDERKVEIICLLKGMNPEEVGAWDVQTINEAFWKLISKEVAYLEEDLLDVFS
jgi:RNA-directed DNA polymerase